METTLRLISDVHGDHEQYLEATKGCEFSVQLGDLGYDWSVLKHVDPERHKVIPGNHECWPVLDYYRPWLLYPYGVLKIGAWEAFFLAGAYSIDRKARDAEGSWFPEEELPFADLYTAYLHYCKVKPRVMLSHEGPPEAIELMKFRGLRLEPPFKVVSITSQTLQLMLTAHRPEEWYFGHWHCEGHKKKDGCDFRCLAKNTYRDILIET